MTSWLAAHGGFVGLGVLAARYVLIGFSIASLAVIVERLWMLRRIRIAEALDYRRILTALTNDDQIQLRAVALQSAAPVGAVLSVALEHLGSSEARLREATQGEVSAQIEGLQHNLPILATAASTAPYVGLFGTVLGILAAFRDIAQTGQTGASVIAGGISEALIMTALGLGVAIPSVMAYNYFSARVNALSSLVETHALDVTERVIVMTAKGELASFAPASVAPASVATASVAPAPAPVAVAPPVQPVVAPPVVAPTPVAPAPPLHRDVKPAAPVVKDAPTVVASAANTQTADDNGRLVANPEKKTIGALEAMKRGTPLIKEESATAVNRPKAGENADAT